MNKKILLLAGAAMFVTGAANAMELNPYIGLDYVVNSCFATSYLPSIIDLTSLSNSAANSSE